MAKKRVTKGLMTVQCEIVPDALAVSSKGQLTVEVESLRTAPHKVLVSCSAPHGNLKLGGKKYYTAKPIVVFPSRTEGVTWNVEVSPNCPKQSQQLDIVAEASRLINLPPTYPQGGMRAILTHAEFSTVSDQIPIPMDVTIK